MKKKIVVLTGAGISKESGISTFRDSNGLWEGHDIVEVASLEGFGRRPERVHKFYNARRAQLFEVEPNAAHYALAELEASSQYEVVIITQNVDDLHERAGSKQVLHMHGLLRSQKCVWCESVSEVSGDLTREDRCESCQKQGGMRPNIVWFGEIPQHMDEIRSHLVTADLFVSIGTSGVVRPAADFVHAANRNEAKSIEMNMEKTVLTPFFRDFVKGSATEVVPEWVRAILQ